MRGLCVDYRFAERGCLSGVDRRLKQARMSLSLEAANTITALAHSLPKNSRCLMCRGVHNLRDAGIVSLLPWLAREFFQDSVRRAC